jgi:hypothetical protein
VQSAARNPGYKMSLITAECSVSHFLSPGDQFTDLVHGCRILQSMHAILLQSLGDCTTGQIGEVARQPGDLLNSESIGLGRIRGFCIHLYQQSKFRILLFFRLGTCIILWELGCHCGVCEYYCFLECDAMQFGPRKQQLLLSCITFEVLSAVVVKSTIFCNIILRLWRWRRHVPPERPLTFNGLHDVLSQKIELISILFTVISISLFL